jgi:Xaa-Pro aminopeptidase
VREELQKKNAKAIVVTMLDEIAWLFNLRGSDIDFNPGMSYAHIINRHLTDHVGQYSLLTP